MQSDSMGPAVHIRPFQPEDAQALAELFFASIRQLGPRHYSPEQTIAWAPAIPDPALYQRRIDGGRIFLVAANSQNRPVAYADLELDGHIDHFYCHPSAAGTGVTLALYNRLEQCGRARGIARLYVEASEGAHGLFLRQGFVEIERHVFLIGGVQIHNYRMEKHLKPS
jgi:putative acetyltransferase